jgi:hypothetical protein
MEERDLKISEGRGPRYLVTAFPLPEPNCKKRQAFDILRASILGPRNHGVTDVEPTKVIALIIAKCCGTLDKLQDDDSLRFLQIFEDSIAVIVSFQGI